MPSFAWEPLAVDYPRGELIEPHRHEQAQIVFAKSGVMRVDTAAGAWVVPPQRALWLPAGVTHWIACHTAVAMRTIYLDQDAAPALGERTAVLAVGALLREIILRLVESESGNRDALLAVLIGELATVPVAPLHLPEPHDARLRRACAALVADPGASTSMAELATMAGASPRTLMRLFPAETGLSFRGWQRQLRLLMALERLADRQPVTSIALDLGYASPSAFIATFRAALGVTPARYFDGRPQGKQRAR